jgi:hypothetical protein
VCRSGKKGSPFTQASRDDSLSLYTAAARTRDTRNHQEKYQSFFFVLSLRAQPVYFQKDIDVEVQKDNKKTNSKRQSHNTFIFPDEQP